MRVQNKVIIVTGGGNGLGRELVLNLLLKDARVVAVDLNDAALQETRKLAEIDRDALTTFVANITDPGAIEKLRDLIMQKHGHVDGIINNAGIMQPFKKIDALDLETIRRVMDVNFYGMLNMCKMFLPDLLSRPEAHIVNISSMGGFLPVPGQSVYGAAKAGVKIVTESMANEYCDTNLKTTVVFPGAMFTNIKANSGLGEEAGAGPEGYSADAALSPVKAAEMIIEGMEKNRARVYVGKDSKTMNFLYRLSPGFASKMIYKKLKHKI
jgi:Short-chain dehydrogenases of various substrate specificities